MNRINYLKSLHKDLDSIFIEIGMKQAQLRNEREDFEGYSPVFKDERDENKPIQTPALDERDLRLKAFIAKAQQARFDVIDFFDQHKEINQVDIDNRKTLFNQLITELRLLI